MSSFLFISATSRIISFDLISPLLHFTASVLQHFIPKLATVPSNSAVGYLNNEVTPNTMNISCATFRPVGDEAAVLGDLKANDTFAFLQDTVQTLNGNGGTEAMYTYLSETAAVAYEMYGLRVGWYDYNELLAWDWVSEAPAQKNDVEIPAGYGFIVQSGYDGAGIIIPSPLAD